MITIRFTSRERYGKAIRHLWANPEKYKVECRGKDYGSAFKVPNADYGFYIEFIQKDDIA